MAYKVKQSKPNKAQKCTPLTEQDLKKKEGRRQKRKTEHAQETLDRKVVGGVSEETECIVEEELEWRRIPEWK